VNTWSKSASGSALMAKKTKFSATAKWLKSAGLEDVHCRSKEVVFSQV